MITAAIYDGDGIFTGQFVGGPSQDHIVRAVPGGCHAWLFDGDPPDIRRYRVSGGQLIEYQPPQPTSTADVDWVWHADLWRWVALPTVAARLRQRDAEVSALVVSKSAEPIALDGMTFDADETARGRMLGTLLQLLLGLGLPAGWEGWRDHDNIMRWASVADMVVRDGLAALTRAIAEREQGLLLAAWAIKATLATLPTVEAIDAFDISQGWPA